MILRIVSEFFEAQKSDFLRITRLKRNYLILIKKVCNRSPPSDLTSSYFDVFRLLSSFPTFFVRQNKDEKGLSEVWDLTLQPLKFMELIFDEFERFFWGKNRLLSFSIFVAFFGSSLIPRHCFNKGDLDIVLRGVWGAQPPKKVTSILTVVPTKY